MTALPSFAEADFVPADVAAAFEHAHPVDILRWAGDRFGDDLVVTASFGDATLVSLVATALPGADVVLLDTGYLFAETLWFAERLRSAYDLNVRVVRPRHDAVADQWQSDPDGCCHARKVEPLQRALAGKAAWVTGLRRADSPTRANAPIAHYDPFRDVVKINPLATWSDADVERYHAIEQLPVHPLAGHGYPSIGCWPCTRPVGEGDDPRSGRWVGSAKTECGLHTGGRAGADARNAA